MPVAIIWPARFDLVAAFLKEDMWPCPSDYAFDGALDGGGEHCRTDRKRRWLVSDLAQSARSAHQRVIPPPAKVFGNRNIRFFEPCARNRDVGTANSSRSQVSLLWRESAYHSDACRVLCLSAAHITRSAWHLSWGAARCRRLPISCWLVGNSLAL